MSEVEPRHANLFFPIVSYAKQPDFYAKQPDFRAPHDTICHITCLTLNKRNKTGGIIMVKKILIGTG
ncbi:MAG: hypothetical protein II110_08045, partial [Treponema sp.]|nr:hypothetical protein [Treponema sp.]